MAIESTQERHRPGNLKQQNKHHKHGRHKSKGFLETVNKGRALMRLNNRKAKHDLRKDERRNQALQLRQKKREETMKAKRGLLDAPLLTAIIPLSSNIKADVAMAFLKAADSESLITHSTEGQVHISVPRFKQRFCFVECDNDNLFDVLDVLKVADTVLFVVSVEGIQSEGEVLLTTALAQGLPTTVVAIVDLIKLPPKKRQDGKIQVQKLINKWLPDEKLMTLEKLSDSLTILRRIGNQKQRGVIQRDKRPRLLAEKTEFVPNPQGGLGTVKLTGYLRGKPLSVNSLIHIPGWGEYQMRQIDAPPDPYPLSQPKSMEDTVGSVEVLEIADPSKQESLESENVPDPMEGEQTWPTAEELKDAEENIKKVKRVPAGTSEYQAAWIPDNDTEEVDDDDEEGGMECDIDAQSEDISEDEGVNDTDTMTVTSEAPIPADKYDQQINLTEEQEILNKIKDARSEQMFPDEVDTPIDAPARERFQRYRGLKSFRTSPWDPKENLPQDYARIFQFQRFDRTHKRILKELEDSDCAALPGTYITIHVAGVSEDLFMSRLGTQPLVVYGMFPHEQKMTAVNMVLKRPSCLESNEPIKSKEQIIFQYGYRRFKACPIFSEHTNGAKHKYERYFQPDGTVVATVFAPIMFPPASVLAFKENKDGTLNLIATGSLLSVNPDRIVLKRIVLSGHPLKVHKRSAVIRFMFFNREDIEWFKPVELRTKYGRRGHIKEPLGTHGHMKCVFDGQLKSQDTVLLTLYKRVFPKWNYDPIVTLNNTNTTMETD